MEVHSFWSRRTAVCPSGGALQYMRTRRRSLRAYQPSKSRRNRDGGICSGYPQYRGLRLASGNQRALVHRQRGDNLGDDVPPDELNHAPKQGLNFGYPYCHGGDIPDPQFGKKRSCSEFIPPAQKLGPHVAALGMRFYTGSMFPAEYRNQIFIAEHGSWNRSTPIGYRITVVQLENNKAVSYKPFAEGWLQRGRAWGRPVDVLVMPDGALLVSDDEAGAIYRIRYKK
jgi:glucose/arabinose dehydrogenase